MRRPSAGAPRDALCNHELGLDPPGLDEPAGEPGGGGPQWLIVLGALSQILHLLPSSLRPLKLDHRVALRSSADSGIERLVTTVGVGQAYTHVPGT